MADNRHVLMGFLAGFGLGIAGAILLPASTLEDARNRVRGGADKAAGFVKDNVNALKDPLDDLVTRAGEMSSGVVASGSRAIDRVTSTLQGKANDAASAAKGLINQGSDAAKNASDQAANQSKDLAHNAGKAMEQGGKRLQGI